MGSVMDQDRDGLFDPYVPPAPHPDVVAVERFSQAMDTKMKVSRNKGRGGWQDKTQCTAEELSKALRGHVDKGDPVDVANFCMMLHQRGEKII